MEGLVIQVRNGDKPDPNLCVCLWRIMKKMFTIAWDVDDVLNDLMGAWFEKWWKPQHSGCMLNYEDLTENPPHHILNIKLEEYFCSLDAFRLSAHYERMQPDSKVLDWFGKHGPAYRHMALTAVPRIASFVSASWVLRYFGDWIRTFHFVPSPRPEDIPTAYESTKAAYLKWLNRADIFIDDHAGNIRDAKGMGIRCIMLSRPWNSGGMKIEKILDFLTRAITPDGCQLKMEYFLSNAEIRKISTFQ